MLHKRRDGGGVLPRRATTTTITMIAIMAPLDSANVLSVDPPAPASLFTVPPEFAVPAPSPQSVVHLSVAKGNEELEVSDMMMSWKNNEKPGSLGRRRFATKKPPLQMWEEGNR